MSNLSDLPENLPPPDDNGECDHLVGMSLPVLHLPATNGDSVSLAALKGITVLYVYPMTGRPDVPLPVGWDQIPGARGCTPQSCAFRDHHDEIRKLNGEVFGLSTQPTSYQLEAAERLHLPFPLLSDKNLNFTHALDLPTMQVDGMTLIKRLTLVCNNQEITKVFYPVFPPDQNASDVISYLERVVQNYS